jgi:glycosyltransferase involved in cell wall biosynthesis
LTSLFARMIGRPSIGTLHDHPRAAFISRARQRLMYWSAKSGLGRVACVSQAVRDACLAFGYPDDKVTVVHNGLPPSEHPPHAAHANALRFGFLGVFSERKGLPLLFEMIDQLAGRSVHPWELHLAGDTLDAAGKQMMAQLEIKFAERAWWKQIRWCGWLKDPTEFLASLDLLICPSAQFDPFPTVLLESARVGVPALAARVGGVEEIVLDNHTGWLFNPGEWGQAAAILERIASDPRQCRLAGERARQRVSREFPVAKMVAEYVRIYSTVVADV